MEETIQKQEAIAACQEALETLEKAKSSLSEAMTSSWFDLLGGGVLASLVKHAQIDALNEELKILQSQLEIAQKELGDVTQALESDFLFSEKRFLFDVVLDNVFTDVQVHDQLKELGQTLEKVDNELKNYLAQLLEEGSA